MSRSIRTIAVHILATAQSSLAKANHVTVHRQLIGELREALGSPVETKPLQSADYEGVLADHRGLVRDLDVLLNGEGAAPQASLCDIVGQLSRWKHPGECVLCGGRVVVAEKTEACPIHTQPGHPFADCTCPSLKASGEPCVKCDGTGRLTIYDAEIYMGQLCSPVGDEPCPVCQPENGNGEQP